jgi:hypothetical protein
MVKIPCLPSPSMFPEPEQLPTVCWRKLSCLIKPLPHQAEQVTQKCPLVTRCKEHTGSILNTFSPAFTNYTIMEKVRHNLSTWTTQINLEAKSKSGGQNPLIWKNITNWAFYGAQPPTNIQDIMGIWLFWIFIIWCNQKLNKVERYTVKLYRHLQACYLLSTCSNVQFWNSPPLPYLRQTKRLAGSGT